MNRSRTWDLTMIGLLVGSIILVFWHESLDPVRQATARTVLEWVDLALVVFFVAEWGWRVQRSGRSSKYALRNSWELLGMIPIIAPVPAFLRALRFLRVVRILRAFKVIGRSLRFWERVVAEPHLKKVGVAALVITLGGAVLVWLLERDVNPALAEVSEAVWWAVVTVTTVGYGDITPQTTMGRFVGVIVMLTGIGVIGTLASSMASVLLDEQSGEAMEDSVAEDAPDSVAGQLISLATLHDNGKIDDEEFKDAKRRVLDRA